MSKFYLQIAILFLSVTILTVNSEGHGKIKGGRAAKSGEFPFIGHILASLYGNNFKVCGCSLVTASKIVTASHCVVKWNRGVKEIVNLVRSRVFFGSLYLMADDAQVSKIKNVKYPRDIRETKYGWIMHDYATAELVNPVQINDRVKPFTLYSTDKAEFKNAWDEMVASKMHCTIIGWGSASYQIVNGTLVTKGPNSFLKTTTAVAWDEQKCQDSSGPPRDNMVPFGQVCLIGVKFGDIALPGDSGSPLLCGDYVWGVATSITYDATGARPMQYLLHWHYLNEFLLPDIGKRSDKGRGWFSGWFGEGESNKGSGSGGGSDGSGGGDDAGTGGISGSSCSKISFTLLFLIFFLG